MAEKKTKRNKILDATLKAWAAKSFRTSYLNDMAKEDLVALIEYCSDWYYNSEQEPLIEDKFFDRLWNELKRVDPKNKIFKKARAPIDRSKSKEKVKLYSWMSSLDKKYPGGALQKWFVKQGVDELVLADKLDGFSIEVTYDNKGKRHIVTGGNGVYGQALPHLSDSFPSLPDKGVKNMVVRCEGVMLKAKFSQFEKLFSSPRSALSNVFNSSTPNATAIISTKMVALEILSPAGMKLHDQYKKLKSLGFEVPHYKVLKNVEEIDEEELIEYYAERRAKSKYKIDGIVVTANKTYTRPNSGNPSYAVAFKENTEDSMVEAEVIAVDGNISRTGRIVPTVHVKPVNIDGYNVSKLTGHNYGYIRDQKINKGSIIKITRSGEVIPYIVSVIKKAKDWAKPLGKENVDWYWDTDLDIKVIAHSSEAQADMAIKKISYFAAQMGIDGLKEGMASKLYFGGIKTPHSLVKNYSIKRLEKCGLGKTQSRILHENINDVLSAGIEIPQLATALSAFGVGIGYGKIKALIDAIPFNDLLGMNESYRIDRIAKVRGFSIDTAEKIADRVDKLQAWIEDTGIKIVEAGKAAPVSNILANQSVLFTGFRSSEVEDWIKRNGGKIATTVNNCTMLLVKDTSKPSSKMLVAIEKNIPIYAVSNFIAHYIKDDGSSLKRLKL